MDQIKDNIKKLKGKLNRDSSTLYQHLYSGVIKKPVEELSWKDPLASQVISDESDIVKNLSSRPIVQEIYKEFVEDFRRCDEKTKPK